jgi:hypothetical protein
MTPQEYAVRAVRAWITNVDMTTIPELRDADAGKQDRFVAQVLQVTTDAVGSLNYAVIAERQDEEWEQFRVDWNTEGVTDLTYPVRFTMNGEVVR